MEKKVVIMTAMHGRHKTVSYCLDKMKDLDVFFIYGYSNNQDRLFLGSQDADIISYKAPNKPLSGKFQAGLRLAQDYDFDIAIMLGSDDYIDQKFLDYAIEQTDSYEHIGFKDIYFEENGQRYYWQGYTNNRKGEASGAGKIYTRKALEKLEWRLYDDAIDRGLDHAAHQRVKEVGLLTKIAYVKEEGLTLVDVKDSHSLTKLYKFEGQLERV